MDKISKQQRKNFIAKNNSFTCESCGFLVPPAKTTYRNHCPQCLASKHVDNIPGDRDASCQGLMPCIGVTGTDPDALDLTHQCLSCGKTINNKVAIDDNRDQIFKLLLADNTGRSFSVEGMKGLF